MALVMLMEMSQLPPAGMLAAARVTLLVVWVSDNAAPSQVLDGACVTVRPAAGDTVMPDWVSAKPLEFVNVSTSVADAFAATLAGE